MKFRNFFLPVLFALALSVVGCSDDDDETTPPAPQSPAASTFGPELAKEWMDLSASLVKTARMPNAVSPPVASRIYGYTGIALYESVVPGMSDHQSLVGQLDALNAIPQPAANTIYDWPTVANNAVANVLSNFFSAAAESLRTQITTKKDSWNVARQAAVNAEVYDRSLLLGQAIAVAVLDWAATDGYAQYHNCAYTPPTGEGLWVPTPPGFAAPLEPCWGQMRTFVLDRSGSDLACDVESPIPYSSETTSDFYAQAMEVYTTVNNRTAEQEAIAYFWADNPGSTPTPPGHWITIAGQLLVQQNMKLDDAAEAYARAGIAVHDAFISCWKMKFEINLLRPITFINQYIDAGWVTMPGIPTPPFPSCSSGHSTSSGAASSALEALFGVVPFTDHSHDGVYPARSFSSLSEAADEAAISRLYGGIHYHEIDNLLGLTEGRCIGEQINALNWLRPNS